MAAWQGNSGLASGNVIGSNMFNLLAVPGVPGVVHPAVVELEVLVRDYPVMIGLTAFLFLFAYGFRRKGRINRLEGGFLLLCYVSYQLLIYFSVTGVV